ncbi:hypothetical protein P4T70_25730 [Bacillus mobilis]|uniref:hypothetical protein n=1 Tax=Bacillus mobilis TaxID=2026190 RepID=UPI002E22A487|nr:hypothetical protein [Bacillus mobilis]
MIKEGLGVIFGLILVVSGLYLVSSMIGSLNEMSDTYLKNKNTAIMTLISDELDVPKREIVLKKDSNENEGREELDLYTATTSKGVYNFKIKETIEDSKLLNGESKPVIENIAQVKVGSADK